MKSDAKIKDVRSSDHKNADEVGFLGVSKRSVRRLEEIRRNHYCITTAEYMAWLKDPSA